MSTKSVHVYFDKKMISSFLLMLMIMKRDTVGEKFEEQGKSCEFRIYSEHGNNGTIMAPGYPSPYLPTTKCIYDFQGQNQERIRIVFQDFDMYHSEIDSDRCDDSGSVNVYVYVERRLEKIDTYCGDKLPRPIMSNGPWMRIELQGRILARKYRGFKAIYSFTTDFALATGTQSPLYPCAFNFCSNESKHGYFYSPNFPGLYPRNTECHYFFFGIMSEKVAIHFNYFDIEGVSPCDAQTASDSVEFSNYHGEDRKFNKYCGILKQFDIESDREFFRITFKSNGRLDGTGFNATFDFINRINITTRNSQAMSRSGIQNNGESNIVGKNVPNYLLSKF